MNSVLDRTESVLPSKPAATAPLWAGQRFKIVAVAALAGVVVLQLAVVLQASAGPFAAVAATAAISGAVLLVVAASRWGGSEAGAGAGAQGVCAPKLPARTTTGENASQSSAGDGRATTPPCQSGGAAGRMLDEAEFAVLADHRLQKAPSVRYALIVFEIERVQQLAGAYGEAILEEIDRLSERTADNVLRGGDLCGRLGRGSCVAMITGLDEGATLEVSGRLRAAVQASLIIRGGEPVALSAVVGACVAKAPQDLASMTRAAKAALEAARVSAEGVSVKRLR